MSLCQPSIPQNTDKIDRFATWWRHQMGTLSALLALCAGNSPVSGEFPSQRPVTRSFDVFFDLRLNRRLSKQSWGWWFETPSCSLWRHHNEQQHSVNCVSIHYPTLGREFEGLRMWGKFVFRTLELTATPTNLANRIKVGYAIDKSRSVQSCGPDRAHQNTWGSHDDRQERMVDFRDSFDRIKCLSVG